MLVTSVKSALPISVQEGLWTTDYERNCGPAVTLRLEVKRELRTLDQE